MNDPGSAMLGYLARCSAVGLAAMLLVALLTRRRGPAAGAMAAHAGLMGLLLTAGLSCLPWPREWSFSPHWHPDAARAVTVPARRPPPTLALAPSTPVRRAISRDGSEPAPTSLADRRDRTEAPRPARSLASVLRRSVAPPGARTTPVEARIRGLEESETRSTWAAWASALVVAGWAIGGVRFATGLVAIRRCVSRSEVVEDAGLLAIVDELRASLGCSKAVTLRESSQPGLPATVGWLRPCILLPEAWREWTGEETRVVLAHELAHIRRGDFATRLAGRFCLIVHFYHPIAHWLDARLRLQQELAADAWGVRLAGGGAIYLTTLARMALRHDAGRAPGPDRPLLPFGGSFLRRMDMLCSENALGQSPESSPWRTRLMTFGLLALVAVGATALRAPLAPAADGDVPAAVDPATESPRAAEAPFDLSRVPAGAVAVVALRPSSLLGHEDLQSLMALARLDDDLKKNLEKAAVVGLALESIEQVLYVQLKADLDVALKDEMSILRRGVLIIRSRTPIDAKAASAALKEFAGEVKVSLSTPDDRTVILGEEATIREVSDRKPGDAPKFAWSEAWKGVERSQIAIAFDAGYVRGMTDPLLMEAGAIELAMFAAPIAPIWEEARAISLGFSLVGDQVEILSLNTAGTVEGAENTYQTVQALMTLTRNAAGSIKRQFRKAMFASSNGLEGLLIAKLADLWANQIFQQIRVERAGRSVRFLAKIDLDTLMVLAQLH